MKLTINHKCRAFSLVIIACFGLFSGCEEVLEVCAPCASVADGDVNISGDPRMDTTVDAIQHIRQFALQAEAAFARDKQLLRKTFGVDQDNGIESLMDAIRTSLWQDQIVTAEILRQRARCWTDMELADRAELSCEVKLACNVLFSASPGDRRPDCLGWFVGQCDGSCDGTCYGKSALTEKCETQCVGTCVNDGPVLCPGTCHGTCSESCDAYSEQGECAGHCQGMCSGICASSVGFPCSGPCYGRCASQTDGGVCQDGECHGRCTQTKNGSGTLTGQCRGNVAYKAYDPQCGDCVAAAENLAWSRLYCEPAKVQVAVRFLPGALVQDVDKTAIVHKATVLENVLSRMATDQAKLALLLDGIDDAGEMTVDSLVPTYTEKDPMPEYLTAVDEYGVAEARKHLPLDKLKARLGWMTTQATSGKFKLAAGVLPCVTPALQEARDILEQMIPVMKIGDTIEVDRSCTEATANHLAPCLFSLRDEQLTLLGLSPPTEKRR